MAAVAILILLAGMGVGWLVRNRLLPALCRFAAVGCDSSLLSHLHRKSVRRGALASFEATIVDRLTLTAYRRARCAGTLSVAHD